MRRKYLAVVLASNMDHFPKDLSLQKDVYLRSALTDFITQHELLSEARTPKYVTLFTAYISHCSPAEANLEDLCLAGKFLAVFYCANELFLDQKNVLESTHFLNAQQAFLDELDAVRRSRFQDQESPPTLDYFVELLASLWKEMTIESAWFGSEPPSLSVYKQNREMTITVHQFVELYRVLCFPNVTVPSVRELISLVTQVIYHDNDLCSKHDESYGKPNLVSLVMTEKGVALRTARELVQKERKRIFDSFQESKTDMNNPSLHPFMCFLDKCIDGNIQTIRAHEERYETNI